jgi:hypothetical protein
MTMLVGTEYNKTIAHMQHTLFVDGVYSKEEILSAALNKSCPHIHLGYNRSYAPDGTQEVYQSWDNIILPLLQDNIWVTLSFHVHDLETILESGYAEYEHFIPLIDVEMPYINQLGYNAVVKITDKHEGNANPGVWYHNVHDLQAVPNFLHKSRMIVHKSLDTHSETKYNKE